MSSGLTSRNGHFTSISGGVGTTIVKNTNGVLHRVLIPGTYIGTLNIHDSATAAGTSATSQIISFGIPTTSVAQAVEVGVNFRKGLVYEATGTPTMTLVWE